MREALADDLPPDVESRLRTRMRSSWRRAVAAAGKVPEGRCSLRAALAVAAVLTLAVGWVVHLEADAGPRAESFLAQQASARVAAQLHRVSAMSCRLETRDVRGRAVRFAIDWQDTGEAEVQIESPEATRHRTVDVPRETTSVLRLTRVPLAPEASRPHDPDLSPAAAHLSPERLASLLAGRWERIPDRPGPRRAWRPSASRRPSALLPSAPGPSSSWPGEARPFSSWASPETSPVGGGAPQGERARSGSRQT